MIATDADSTGVLFSSKSVALWSADQNVSYLALVPAVFVAQIVKWVGCESQLPIYSCACVKVVLRKSLKPKLPPAYAYAKKSLSLCTEASAKWI